MRNQNIPQNIKDILDPEPPELVEQQIIALAEIFRPLFFQHEQSTATK
jgi:hypothetical protein